MCLKRYVSPKDLEHSFFSLGTHVLLLMLLLCVDANKYLNAPDQVDSSSLVCKLTGCGSNKALLKSRGTEA